VGLMNGLVFASYRFLLKLQLPTAETLPTITQITLAGAGCGIVSSYVRLTIRWLRYPEILTHLFFLLTFGSIVTTPTELIKIRQQSMLTPTKARQVALEIFREYGIRGLYRGMLITALRDCGYGVYFAAVSDLK